jgi:hypothetical protein
MLGELCHDGPAAAASTSLSAAGKGLRSGHLLGTRVPGGHARVQFGLRKPQAMLLGGAGLEHGLIRRGQLVPQATARRSTSWGQRWHKAQADKGIAPGG